MVDELQSPAPSVNVDTNLVIQELASSEAEEEQKCQLRIWNHAARPPTP